MVSYIVYPPSGVKILFVKYLGLIANIHFLSSVMIVILFTLSPFMRSVSHEFAIKIHVPIFFTGTGYDEINEEICELINDKKIFPDYHDVREIVYKWNKKHNLKME